MFDFLSRTFSSIFERISGSKSLDDQGVNVLLEQIKNALFEADVPYELVHIFMGELESELKKNAKPASLKPKEYVLQVVYHKLVGFLGSNTTHFSITIPCVIMVMGLQGSGKTTTVAKLARYLMKEAEKRGKQRRILLASVDYYRPAAREQLHILAQQVKTDFFNAVSLDVCGAAQEIFNYWREYQYDLLLLDTAGRAHHDNHMLSELRYLDELFKPKQKLLVLDAMMGQSSLAVARAFEQSIGFCSAILTKVDSDARGGTAFSFRYALKKPIVFVGSGEKLDDLESFHPERVASRMLGMGDIKSLLDRVQEKVGADEQQTMSRSFQDGKLNLKDFASQIEMIERLGSFSSIMKYIPGMNRMVIPREQLDDAQKELRRFRAIISSMTPKEQVYPRIINESRKLRIARGAGVATSDVNKLLSQFDHMQQYVKLIKKRGGIGPFGK